MRTAFIPFESVATAQRVGERNHVAISRAGGHWHVDSDQVRLVVRLPNGVTLADVSVDLGDFEWMDALGREHKPDISTLPWRQVGPNTWVLDDLPRKRRRSAR